MTPPPVPAEAGDLMRVMAHAVVSVAARPAGRRGPWMFDEEALQTLASQCQSVLAAAPPPVSADHASGWEPAPEDIATMPEDAPPSGQIRTAFEIEQERLAAKFSADHAGVVEIAAAIASEQWLDTFDKVALTKRINAAIATALQQSAERIAGLERRLATMTHQFEYEAGKHSEWLEKFMEEKARADKAEESNAHLFSIISDIREASGLGGKPMLAELADAIKATLAARDAEIERLTREATHPSWVADMINRSVDVENWLRAPAQAARKNKPVPPPPTPEEMERWANRLGIPSEVAAFSKQPEAPADRLRDAVEAAGGTVAYAPGGFVVHFTPLEVKLKVAVEALEKAEHGARNLMPYLTWQLSPESPGYHPTFDSAVAYFRGQFSPEVFAPGSSRFDEWQANRLATIGGTDAN